jgi:hypothetical protein
MKIDGGCHCGRIRFEAEVEHGTVRICHCTDCQTLSGTAFRAAISAPAGRFVLHGAVKTYVKTADSGARRVHAFCPDCGTPIYSSAIESPAGYTLRLGTIRQRAELGAPRAQIWCMSAMPWSFDLGEVPKLARQ